MKLALLDRDGVLNRVVVDPEQGTIDSPLHPDQVELYPWVPEALLRLNRMGYGLAVVSNQPSAAKKKTTLANLEETHAKVLRLSQAGGAKILSSKICFHRSEDGCECRKPKPKMIVDLLGEYQGDASNSWMIGDGVTDVQAGKAAGVLTAYFGSQKCDSRKILDELSVKPDFWGDNLLDFVKFLEKKEN